MNTTNLKQACGTVADTTERQQEQVVKNTTAALRFCRMARAGMAADNARQKAIALHQAAEALEELRTMPAADPDHALMKRLPSVCTFLKDQLALAKMYNDAEILDSVMLVLTDMQAAWLKALPEPAAQYSDSPQAAQNAAPRRPRFKLTKQLIPKLASLL